VSGRSHPPRRKNSWLTHCGIQTFRNFLVEARNAVLPFTNESLNAAHSVYNGRALIYSRH